MERRAHATYILLLVAGTSVLYLTQQLLGVVTSMCEIFTTQNSIFLKGKQSSSPIWIRVKIFIEKKPKSHKKGPNIIHCKKITSRGCFISSRIPLAIAFLPATTKPSLYHLVDVLWNSAIAFIVKFC